MPRSHKISSKTPKMSKVPRGETLLSPDLRHLVKWSGAILGEVIRRELGVAQYRRIESLRREMASLRGMNMDQAYLVLSRSLREIERLGAEERRGIAHSFSLLLELMNACENAYRSFRLEGRKLPRLVERPKAVISVLTAHPTEARSPQNIAVFHQIQEVLIETLKHGEERQASKLTHLLEVAWRISIARNRKPTVEDEAEHLYSILLRPEIMKAILAANEELCPVYFRSWVGGDKDGHPGVDERATLASLRQSRERIHRYVTGLMDEVRETVELLKERELDRSLSELQRSFRPLRRLEKGDARRILIFREALGLFASRYRSVVGAPHPTIARIEGTIRVFPALLIPLELREASDEILEASRKGGKAIERMLRAVRDVSRGGNPKWYARGLVISMTRDKADIDAGCALVRKVFGGLELPVIPLFEQASALQDSSEIVSAMLRDPLIRKAVLTKWNGFLEVMLGYSDSAKEMGVLPSRLAISETVNRLDGVCRKAGVKPLFFHGSGGSTDRGGGSIEEQTSWWPESALRFFKVTVQGEMVERMFSTPEIALRQFSAAAEQLERHEMAPSLAVHRPSRSLDRFAERVSRSYREKIVSKDFLEIVHRATPYRMLQKLRIGSRPSKRAATLSVGSLRAIPWVLCWTQTRVLFPTWWGVGSAWQESNRRERAELRGDFRRNDLFRTYVKALGFTLAKIELPVFRLYLERSGLSAERVEDFFREFEREYQLAIQFVRAVTGEKDLLWFRTWLGESIRLRSPMIHPLNLLQIANRDFEDVLLTRETVTGIASGMLTTG